MGLHVSYAPAKRPMEIEVKSDDGLFSVNAASDKNVLSANTIKNSTTPSTVTFGEGGTDNEKRFR